MTMSAGESDAWAGVGIIFTKLLAAAFEIYHQQGGTDKGQAALENCGFAALRAERLCLSGALDLDLRLRLSGGIASTIRE